MSRPWPQIGLLLLLPLLIGGCWDAREINQLALVMAVGVDQAEDSNRFLVTAQIARPAVAGAGGGGDGGGGQEEPVFTASADGDTLFEAIRNLARFTSRRIMWAHNMVIVIGESVAREDITPVIDFFTRNQELRLRTWIVVARGTDARSIVTTKTGMENIPGASIAALLRYAELPGESVRADVARALWSFLASDVNVILPAIRLSPHLAPAGNQEGEKASALQAELKGVAIFNGTRLVGFVDEDAARGLLWIRGELRNSVITLSCPGHPARNMAVEIRSPSVDVTSEIRGQRPTFRIRVDTEGWLNEQDCVTEDIDVMQLQEMTEERFAEGIEEDIRSALDSVQRNLGTDVFLYGFRIHRQHPQWWRTNKDHWNDMFPEVATEVSVQARIPRMGIYVRPMNLTAP